MNHHNKRYNHTIQFLNSVINKKVKILDLGTENKFSSILREKGYRIENTKGEDLDLNPQIVNNEDVDVVTAFEILEHLVAPFNVLSEIKAKKLVVTVPLKLWFARAYKGNEEWDRHFHEFEDWQFDWLLEKAGWTIVKTEKWTSPVNKIGIRPILRRFTPRYYAVYAERK